jgi:hypothetical protein
LVAARLSQLFFGESRMVGNGRYEKNPNAEAIDPRSLLLQLED